MKKWQKREKKKEEESKNLTKERSYWNAFTYDKNWTNFSLTIFDFFLLFAVVYKVFWNNFYLKMQGSACSCLACCHVPWVQMTTKNFWNLESVSQTLLKEQRGAVPVFPEMKLLKVTFFIRDHSIITTNKLNFSLSPSLDLYTLKWFCDMPINTIMLS